MAKTEVKKRQRTFEDLSDRRFGLLKVLYRADDYMTKSGKSYIMWHCKCECGNEIDVRGTNLKNNHTTSCGCTRKVSMISKNLEDLTDQTFGYWKVLYRAESVVEPSGRKATMWHCRCKCGTERDIRAGSLKGKLTYSCGCYKHEVLSVKRDLSDQYFGRWYVIGPAKDKVSPTNGRAYKMWHCRCECGTERDVTEQSLISNKSVSCGCYRKERCKESVTFEDLSNRKFGYWKVIKRAEDRFYPGGGRAQMWECQCKCGSIHIVAGNMLKSGISQSCGCLNSPRAEIHVSEYLDVRGLEYETQKTYDDLRGIGGGLLSYDFLVYKNGEPYCLIECQGEQHFRPIKHFGGNERFKMRKEHDKRKAEYAKKVGLRLIEVLYDCRTYDDISNFLDENL